ncbi:MAG: hypothetical protein CFE43_07915 [Burkholderiales bacterium PBB3]|nr:MAG: hypothetical protein CFE43_07915 [Burkholderiales bacterium PBB3]
MPKSSGLLKKIRKVLGRYPDEYGVAPTSFYDGTDIARASTVSVVVTIQSVPDKLYFLLFGAICAQTKRRAPSRVEAVIVRAVSGAVGMGWIAELKRSACAAWFWTSPWVRAYGVLVQGVAYRCATWMHPVQDLSDWFKSKHLWQQLQRQGGTLSLKIGNIEVADLLVDSYLRFKPSPEFDVDDIFVRRLVWQALRDVRQAHAYFAKAKPRWYLTSYTTYLEHGIPARVALAHGVTVWSFGNLSQFGKKLSVEDSFHTADFGGYRQVFEKLDCKSERLDAAREQLLIRLSGGIDAATSYMRQSAYGQSSVEMPRDLDGAVVIFLHDFYDSPHVYPALVFDDFWCWICFTIEVLQKVGVPFYLKPHPNQITLSDQVLERLRQKYFNLKWVPAGTSNTQLAAAGMACGVTVYGTVAHELAYLGVPSIGCARHPHHAFDFCRTAATREEYQEMLETYSERPISKEVMQRQALIFYYMHNLFGDGDSLALKQAFVELWMACNMRKSSEAEVMSSFKALTKLPAFDRFVDRLWETSC